MRATALTLHDLLGGELLEAEVLHADGTRQGFHVWNRLTSGVEVDLTLEQFSTTELVQKPRVVRRPPGPPRRGAVQYLLMRTRVFAALGPSSPDAAPPADRR